MPKTEERRRGGAKRYRTKRLPGGKFIRFAIVPKPGPRGGHTVAGPVRKKKPERGTRRQKYLERRR
ncbi:MAG TPA: hypothetical protein VM243_05630, partial [Phycisphaerae bacterium]|nr:hypothetical protein [Phycisphaerae bacterium]